MGSDFSALDAELDTLGAGPVVDVLALAATYAGKLAALSDIDAALGELDRDDVTRHLGGAREPSAELPNFLAGRSGVRESRTPDALRSRAEEPLSSTPANVQRERTPASEEIVLPDPIVGARPDERSSSLRSRAETRGKADESGEPSLEGGTPRSGSFSLDGGILPGNRDDTIETNEEELVEADVDLVDLRSESAPMLGMPLAPSPPPLFDLQAPNEGSAQEEADAAFAELFAEATRQSNAPAGLHSSPPPPAPYAGDAEIFDSGGLAYVENLEQSAAIADTIAAEELDSAEFEIVMDDDSRTGPPTTPPPRPSQHPSQPPEKRPSFLGRLFGRKEE